MQLVIQYESLEWKITCTVGVCLNMFYGVRLNQMIWVIKSGLLCIEKLLVILESGLIRLFFQHFANEIRADVLW